MAELEFETALSFDEIDKNFEDFDFFENLMEGLEDALAYSKGTPRTGTIVRKRSLPDINVHTIRASLNMTQKAFANVLGVSCRTVEAWEIGRSNPSPTARKLMFLIQEDHSLIKKLE